MPLLSRVFKDLSNEENDLDVNLVLFKKSTYTGNFGKSNLFAK